MVSGSISTLLLKCLYSGEVSWQHINSKLIAIWHYGPIILNTRYEGFWRHEVIWVNTTPREVFFIIVFIVPQLSFISQHIFLIGYFFLIHQAFSSFLPVDRFLNYAVSMLQYTCDFICHYNIDSINPRHMYFNVFDRTQQPHKGDQAQWVVYLASHTQWDTETRIIVSRNSWTTAKQIWIVAQLVNDFSDASLLDCWSTKDLGLLDVGMKSFLAIISQQLQDIFGFVEQLFHIQCWAITYLGLD